MIIHSKQQFLGIFLKKLVSYYPKELEIEFKVTKFTTIFLDISYGIGYETYTKGRLYYRIYQKPSIHIPILI